MKTLKIKKCVTIWVAGLSLGVVWADGLGRGLGPLFGPRGGLAEETDGWAGGTAPDHGAWLPLLGQGWGAGGVKDVLFGSMFGRISAT